MNDEYLDFAKGLANEAGKIMMRYFRAEDIGAEWKADNTPLTIADTKINQLVIERVKSKFPEHGVLGEEDSYRDDSELIWVVDPIDGTIPYSISIPVSTFSLALVSRQNGQPIVGVIYDPFLDHLYRAAKDSGAWLNNRPIHTSNQTELSRSYASVIGSFDKSMGTEHMVETLRKQGVKSFSVQSQAYAAAHVASGALIGSIFAYGSPWDSAAAALIVAEAGGIVTDLKGKPRRYDQFEDGCLLSANREIHNKLRKVVDAHYRN